MCKMLKQVINNSQVKMGRPIGINVSFNNVSHVFTCNKKEFMREVAQHYGIDMNSVDMYAVRRGAKKKIQPNEILDAMKIEIVLKNGSNEGGQRSLRSYFDESVGIEAIAEKVITKLKNNTPLNGNERKSLVEFLEELPTNSSLSKKRKIDDFPPSKSTVHKKSQVNLFREFAKDSFAQTDPVPIGNDTDPEEESIPIILKKLASKKNPSKKEVERLMGLSFDDRRNFIMRKNPLVHAVKDKYPFLFSLEEVKNELDRIFYPGKCEDFLSNMLKYSKHILSISSSEDEIYILTGKSVIKCHNDQEKTYARIVGSIFMLAKILEEDWSFIHLSDYPHGSSDIYPHIEASPYSLKEIFSDRYLYPVIVEDQILCEASNLPEAILCLIATFFIFNVDYPKSCRRTLIVFEKLFLCANDTTDIDEMTSQMIKMLELKASNEK